MPIQLHDDSPRLAIPDRAESIARMKIDRATWAVRAFSRYDRAAVMKIARAVAEAAHQAAQTYAEWAVRETGMGVVEHKKLKNELSAHPLVDFYEGMDLVNPRVDPARKMVEIPKPAGVVLALTPATNPVSTLYYKTLLAVLSRSAVIFSPHPMAKACCNDAAVRLEAAAVAAGAPAGLIQCIEEPSVPLVQALMASPKVQVILATGGSPMVRAAYASGNPAIGVGPGNAPVYVDPDTDQNAAAKRIVDSKSFDNSVLCTNESVLISLDQDRSRLERALRANGAHICNEAEVAKLRSWLFPEGHLNTAAVGKSAVWIAAQAGFRVVPSTRILIAPVEVVGLDEPLSKEKLAPVLAWATVGTFERATGMAQMILRMSGAGHSAAFHGEDPQKAMDFASALPVYRVVVNAPCSQGAAGFATHLAPSFMIGTGYAGRSSVGENIGPQHLVHWTRLAWNSDAAVPMGDFTDVRAPFDGPSAPPPAAPRPVTLAPAPAPANDAGMDRDMLRQLILQELRELTRGQS
ncbi:aldehyde dehydrogenase family protein [Pseudogemmobacter humi]|uniref:Aldehyde-alcohol dehydrogenase n=1 Tax=Pseudogemmobacter humi TaxID=2483812 RepID=A0A3P5WYI8_9RHOB|nr:aldehyde dehydrogenase family protein [Pseudogemmobacter humi]VDC23386.1 Aldehyde-alcohol dehydrogenase [Pseudogemmobacter humi]